MSEKWSDRFDLLILQQIFHDLAHPAKAAAEMYRVCKKGGTLCILDNQGHSNPKDNVGDPMAPIQSMYSMYYCLSMSLSAPGSEAHGPTAGVEKLVEMIEAGGFDFKKNGSFQRLGLFDLLLICTK